MTDATRHRVRAGLVYLTVSFLAVGLWATFAARSFYDDFPGGGRQWLVGDGPYNAHLVSDAGVGFLAVGAVLLLAAVWLERRTVQAASAAVIMHNGLHLLFHLRHPNDELASVDRLMSNGGLALGAVIAVIILMVVTRAPARRAEGAPV